MSYQKLPHIHCPKTSMLTARAAVSGLIGYALNHSRAVDTDYLSVFVSS